MEWLDRFHLSPTQQKGYLSLLIILLIVLIVRISLVFWVPATITVDQTLIDELNVWKEEQRLARTVPHTFDPNVVSDSFIYNCKISGFAANNWIKYKESFRRFEKPSDLLGVYGMDTSWFEINQDSIRIDRMNEVSGSSDYQAVHLFSFDPNSASQNEFVQLGFPFWLAERVVKYRDSGRRFESAADLLKVYDFPEELFHRIEPYVIIDHKEPELEVESISQIININQADSSALTKIPGIGPVYAKRIRDYRNQLGGYADPVQLLEVYGMDSKRLNDMEGFITIDSNEINRLSINSANFKTLLAHPYLSFKQVKSIVNFRETVGPHQKVENLQNLEGFEKRDIDRLTPYLTFE